MNPTNTYFFGAMNLMSTSTLVKKLSIAAGVAVIALGAVGIEHADAAMLNNSSGLASPNTTITFDEIVPPAGTVVTTQYSGLGVSFSNLVYASQGGGFPHIDNNNLGNFNGGLNGGLFSIHFLQQQTEAAFAMVTNQGTSTFTALLNGVVAETFTLGTTVFSSNNFYGFTNILFDEIQVTPGGYGSYALIDNIQLGSSATESVPEPASVLGLLALGALGAGSARKRQQSQKA